MEADLAAFGSPLCGELKRFCKRLREAYREIKEDLTPYRDDRYYRYGRERGEEGQVMVTAASWGREVTRRQAVRWERGARDRGSRVGCKSGEVAGAAGMRVGNEELCNIAPQKGMGITAPRQTAAHQARRRCGGCAAQTKGKMSSPPRSLPAQFYHKSEHK